MGAPRLAGANRLDADGAQRLGEALEAKLQRLQHLAPSSSAKTETDCDAATSVRPLVKAVRRRDREHLRFVAN
jgi:hypothetical protein